MVIVSTFLADNANETMMNDSFGVKCCLLVLFSSIISSVRSNERFFGEVSAVRLSSLFSALEYSINLRFGTK